jgi:hypothetical protein
MIELFLYISLAFNFLMGFAIGPLYLFYLIYFFLLILSFAEYALFRPLKLKFYFIDFIPLLMVLIWLYGLMIGIIKNNNIYYAFRNFFGMNFYLFYYVLIIKKISIYSVIRVLIYAAMTVLIFSIIIFLLSQYSYFDTEGRFAKLITGRIYTGSSTGKGRIWFLSQTLVFILFAFSFSRLLLPKTAFLRLKSESKNFLIQGLTNIFFASFIFCTCCFIIFFMTDSAGNSLAGICILIIISSTLFIPKIIRGRLHFGTIFFLFIVVALSGILIKTTYADIIIKIISKKGNLERIVQIRYLLNDLTFWGNGLGAIIPGYSRNAELPYGFEIIYLNIFHKFGIAATLIILTYCYTFFNSIKMMLDSINYGKKIIGIICIGSLAYLFITIGNPMAFNNIAVLLHCIVLYIIRNECYVRRHPKQSIIMAASKA